MKKLIGMGFVMLVFVLGFFSGVHFNNQDINIIPIREAMAGSNCAKITSQTFHQAYNKPKYNCGVMIRFDRDVDLVRNNTRQVDVYFK